MRIISALSSFFPTALLTNLRFHRTEAKKLWSRSSRTRASWTSARRGGRRSSTATGRSRGCPSRSRHRLISEGRSGAPAIAAHCSSRARTIMRATMGISNMGSIRHMGMRLGSMGEEGRGTVQGGDMDRGSGDDSLVDATCTISPVASWTMVFSTAFLARCIPQTQTDRDPALQLN